MRSNLLNIEEEFSLKIAKGKRKIRETIICIRRRERKLLNQIRKNPTVDLFNKHKNANGESKIKTLVKIYRKVKCRTKVNEEIESILLRIPSIEKILNEPFEL